MSDVCKACGEQQSSCPANILFHPFPVDIEKRKTWEEKCRDGGVFDSSQTELAEGQNWAVCSRHFRRADYLTINDIPILRPNAAPSIFRRKPGENPVAEQTESAPKTITAPSTGALVAAPKNPTKSYYKNFASVEAAHNWNNRCRVCGKLWASSVLSNLYGEKGQAKKMSSKINNYLPIMVDSDDIFPLRICKPCVTKLNDYHEFYENCKQANSDFQSEMERFNRAKEQESEAKIALEKKIERQKLAKERELEEALNPDARRNPRKTDPAGKPSKRGGYGRRGPASKRSKYDESTDDDELEDFEIVEDKFTIGPNEADESAENVEKETDKQEDLSRLREGTQRFNLRSAPKRNSNISIYVTPRRPPTPPSILRQKTKVEEEPVEATPSKRTRQRGLPNHKPRNKRYFITRNRYGTRIVNQKCDSEGCPVVCETVSTYLEHKYLTHDESNFSFCRYCSQVYETKPRNVDNGHRHLAELVTVEKEVTAKAPLETNCRACGKEFGDRQKLMQHRKAMHGNFNCSECGKHFSAMGEFKKHVQDHIFTRGGLPHRIIKRNKKDKFVCEICKERTSSFLALNVHTMKEHDQNFKYLLCDCCNNVFYTDQLLRLHKEMQTTTDLQLCENCGGTFGTGDELKHHRKTCASVLSNKPLACQHCDIFVHPNKMSAHLRWHLTRKAPERCQKCLLSKWTAAKHNCKYYKCEACQLGFNGFPRYLSHKRTHVNKDTKYFCNVCTDQTFDSFEELVAHFGAHAPEEVKESRMKYMSTQPSHRVCPTCLECVSRNVMRKHRRNKHELMVAPELTEQEVLTCPVCGELQDDIEKYITHRLGHKQQLMLNCPHCPLAFDNENRRSIHVMRCHSIDRRVVCDFCNKVFSSQQKIRVHIMRHLKYKPYVCQQPGCKASYYLVGDWRKHSMLHLGINPNVCKICNKQFMKPESLLVHNKKWHSDAPPTATIEIDAGIQEEEEEQVHEVQLKEEPAADIVYQCCKCEYQDRTEEAVLQHLERDHVEEVVVSCEGEMAELAGAEGTW